MKRNTYAKCHFEKQHNPRIRSDGRKTDDTCSHEADKSLADLRPDRRPFLHRRRLDPGAHSPGFDLMHHDLSLLANGDLGWIQITNLVLTGLLVAAFAVGVRQALYAGRGRTWGPILLGIYGLGLIGAGFFTADPAFGFPPGTPADAHAISWQGLLHIITAGIGFLALIAACFVLARCFASRRQRGWAVYSFATGVIFFAAFVGVAIGSGQPWSVIGFWIGVVFAWAWIWALAMKLLTERASAQS